MFQRKNFAYGKVATAPSPAASGTTLVLETGQGTRFPNTSGGTYVCVVKQTNLPATPDNAEVVLVTSHDPANDNFTITREQEGSDARTIEVGDEFYLSPTDGVWDQIDKLTTKGDLLGFSTEYVRVPVGTDTYVLTADSTDDQGVAWKAIGAESKIIGEVPTGTINGTNDDFELSEEPFSGTLQVYLNGVRQKITDDYTLSGTTITFVTPPLTGSSILCDFNQNVTPAGNADTLDGQHAPAGTIVGTSDTQTLTNKTLTSPKINEDVALTATATQLNAQVLASNDGWISANETWEYVSVDDPTGIFRVNADVTGKYSAGMRIKMTNGGNVIYGIITVVGAFSGGYTSITFLHQIDPTDNLALVLMANSAITLPYYSTQKAPYGFPLEPTKWQVVIKDTGVRTTNTPTQNTWYNTNSILINLPIGSWKLGYSGLAGVGDSTVTVLDVQTSLSTAADSVSDSDFLSYVWWNGASATLEAIGLVTKEKEVNVTSKTPYYLIHRTQTAGTTKIFWFGGATGATTTIKANCAYL